MDGENLLHTSMPHSQDALMAKRLLAVGMIEEGVGFLDVATRLGVGVMALEKWHRLYTAGGFELLRDSYPTASLDHIDRIRKEKIRAEELRLIANATDNAIYRKRLEVVAALLEGKKGKAVAAHAGIPLSTATSWLQYFRTNGLDGIKPRHHKRTHLDRSALFSEGEKQGIIRDLRAEIGKGNKAYDRRLLAVAIFLEEGTTTAAGKATGAATSVVTRWIDRYREFGIEGLRRFRQV